MEEFIKGLRESGIKTALATSSVWFTVEKAFEKIPILKELFDSVTTGEEVVNKKPAPDLFLVAADKLDVRPEECLVIEDAGSGIEAADEAGMKVIAIARNKEHAKTLIGADMVVKSYNQLTENIVGGI